MGLIAKINVIELRKAIKAAVDDVFSAQCVRDVVFSRMCKEMEDRFEWYEQDAGDESAQKTIDRLQTEITELKAKNGELYSKWLHEGRY